MNQYRMKIYACEDCCPPGVHAFISSSASEIKFRCSVCDKLVTKMTIMNYSAEHILDKEYQLFHKSREVDELKVKNKILEKKVEILENHIRFQPRGDGALEALEHFMSLADPDQE